MRREPDNLDVIDDSGSYDVRELRGQRGDRIIERIIERPSKTRENWLMGLIAVLIASGVTAAWGVSNDVAGLKTEVRDLRDQVGRLERLLEPRYRGGPDEPHAR